LLESPTNEASRSVTWDRVAEQLQHAHAQWLLDEAQYATRLPEAVVSLPRSRADEFVERARQLLARGTEPAPDDRYSALIVTKAPHTGSDLTVGAILARCLAFDLTVQRVVRLPVSDADRIAHALYPDVWLNFARLPSGKQVWEHIDQIFDTADYRIILGEPYQRSAVVTGYQACLENNLTRAELMSIWQTGREPLTRGATAATYGPSAVGVLFGTDGGDAYHWYRGPFPVGIHRVSSNLMAFSLRHERLYGGRPVIVLNGHFTLLSQRFCGVADRGPTVIELGLGDAPTIRDVRLRLIGAADQPGECLPGTIRRDACDGFFLTDAPGDPIVPWANAVHASDGYLAGTIETAGVLGEARSSGLTRRLGSLGYTPAEIETLVMRDPIVTTQGDEQRLTRRTAMLPPEECLAAIRRWFPPLGADHMASASAYLLAVLVGADGASRPELALDQPQPEPGSRLPAPWSVHDCTDLPSGLTRDGHALIAAGGLGLLVPLAGSGGRFGGYHVAEGTGSRLKPLLPIFKRDGHPVSSLDVRAGHARFLARRLNAAVPMLLSCSHVTEPRVREWRERTPHVHADLARVPEMYRIRADQWHADTDAPDASGADAILRDQEGNPLLKPPGSLGLLVSGIESGVLQRWQQQGVRVVAAANADDVGFRVDTRIVGLFATSPALDAVVLTTPLLADETVVGTAAQRLGLLRERPAGRDWSAYIEEHAKPAFPARDEQFNTNQIYWRLESLLRLFADRTPDCVDGVRQRLPLYFEVKQVPIGDFQVGALHAYQTYSDVLRLLPEVTALSMTRMPRAAQAGGYAPLKVPSDVEVAQAVLDAISTLDDGVLID
jgi:hypothetical protein